MNRTWDFAEMVVGTFKCQDHVPVALTETNPVNQAAFHMRAREAIKVDWAEKLNVNSFSFDAS